MIIRESKDTIKIIKKLNVDINELLEAIDGDEKEVILQMHLNKDKLNEVMKLDQGDY